MKTLKAQLEAKTQEYEETALNWKKGEETLRRKISQWKEGEGRQPPEGSKGNK